MINTLKNWWVELIGFALVVLDQGFDLIEPMLNQVGASDRFVQIIRLVFGFYGIFIVYKKRLPTQNPEKLQDLVDKKLAQANGDPIPPGGPKG